MSINNSFFFMSDEEILNSLSIFKTIQEKFKFKSLKIYRNKKSINCVYTAFDHFNFFISIKKNSNNIVYLIEKGEPRNISYEYKKTCRYESSIKFIDHLHQRYEQLTEIYNNKKIVKKRESKYNKISKERLMTKLRKFLISYDNGVSISKSAKDADLDYKTAKMFLSSELDISRSDLL